MALPMTKYTAPTKLDAASYGSIWKEMTTGDDGKETFNVYMQTSRSESRPKWVLAKDILDSIFNKLYLKDDFIVKCLLLYGYANDDGHTIKDLFKSV